MEETIKPEKQAKNKVYYIAPYMWKKGQSGNILGRPKGKTMKEYVKEYLERMTDEERDAWLEGLSKDKIWEMAEGKARQDTDITSGGKVINITIPQPVLESFNIDESHKKTGGSDSQ